MRVLSTSTMAEDGDKHKNNANESANQKHNGKDGDKHNNNAREFCKHKNNAN